MRICPFGADIPSRDVLQETSVVIKPCHTTQAKYHSIGKSMIRLLEVLSLMRRPRRLEIHRTRESAIRAWVIFTVAVISTASLIWILVQLMPNPNPSSQLRCHNPTVRKEWRTLKTTEQLAYIDAVLCLTKTPSIASSYGSLYDDLARVHVEIAPGSMSAQICSLRK